MNPSEYQEEYCGMGKSMAGGGGGGGSRKGGGPGDVFPPCSKSFEEQPVGGRSQARAKAASATRSVAMTSGQGRLPAYDEDMVATVYSGEDRGTHRMQPHWRDNRWAEPRRADTSTLYEPAERDPPNRNNWYVYRTSLVDPLDTPCKPMAAPDVHKLRYMSTNYMTPDDWY